MKKKFICILLMGIMLCCNACQEVDEDTRKNIDMRAEIDEVLANKTYDNIEICFDKMANYEGQELIIATVDSKYINEGLSFEESMELYTEEVFPRLLDREDVNKELLFDADTCIDEEDNRLRYYEKSYKEIIATIDEYESVPRLVYEDGENYTELYYTGNWLTGVYLTQGVLGRYADSMSAFHAYEIIKDEKIYDCRLDSLTDKYMLMDGEKTVAEAKEEIEKYLDAHYPLTGDENGFKNEVFSITVGKIEGAEYYAFKAKRTLSYDGIPIREMPFTQDLENELGFMGEAALCESNKLDITIGLINTFTEPEIERTIQEYIPFAEVMERVSYYLTGETKFQLVYGGIEYRMFYADEGYHMVPYWYFIAENPNDDTVLKVYVDIETGEITHFDY